MLTHDARVQSATALLACLILLVAGTAGCRTVVDAPRELAELTNTESSDRQSQAEPVSVERAPATQHDIKSAEEALSSTVVQHEQDAIRPKRVDSRGWFLDSSVPLYLAYHLGKPRWHHRALENLLDQPVSTNDILSAGAQSEDLEIRATALIGLARTGEVGQDGEIAQLVRNPKVNATTKGALLEAIADVELIIELFEERDNLIEKTSAKDKFSERQLREQFWFELASTVPSVRSDERFTKNFLDHPPEIQQTILDLMLSDTTCAVPDSVTNRFNHLTPVVMRRIDLWHGYLRTVAAIDVLAESVRSADFTTRESATIGLGREGSRSAEALLLNISENDATLTQVAAVVAWGLMPRHEEWPRLVESKSWRVRLAAAQWIPLTSRNLASVKKLEKDSSHLVRQAILDRTSTPAEQPSERKPAEQPHLPKQEKVVLTSDEVVALLDQIDQAEHAAEPADRTQARQQLLLSPAKVLAAVDQVAKPLSSYENNFLFDVLLPQCDPSFQRLQEATTGSSHMTMIALRELQRRSEQAPLPELVIWRLGQHCERFTPLDWQTLMATIENDNRPATESLVRRALGHGDPMVRARACDHVCQFPLPDVISPLEDSLEHESTDVRAAATKALAKIDGPNHRETFVKLLLDREVDVQLAAAKALDAIDDPRGIQHIYRMTYASSRDTRLKGTHAITARENTSDIPELMRLLDDETSIRLAAIEGLCTIVPLESNPPPKNDAMPVDAQCAAWKNWFDRQSPQR